jgi:hypothetical protein
MDQIFLPLLIGTTSVAALVMGVRGLGLSWTRLKVGVQCALEAVGASVVFLFVNLAVGLPIILAVRALTNQFVSVYLLNDVMLVVLSTVQGMVFCCWRRS